MTGKTTVSRRTVAKGLAWAVPAVAVTAATPAYAASSNCVTATSSSCTLAPPNSSTVKATLTFAKRCTPSVTVKVTSVSDLKSGSSVMYNPADPTITIVKPGDTGSVTVTFEPSNGNITPTVTYTVDGVPKTLTLSARNNLNNC